MMMRKALNSGDSQSCDEGHRKPGRTIHVNGPTTGTQFFTEGSPTKLPTPCKTVPAVQDEAIKHKSLWGYLIYKLQ